MRTKMMISTAVALLLAPTETNAAAPTVRKTCVDTAMVTLAKANPWMSYGNQKEVMAQFVVLAKACKTHDTTLSEKQASSYMKLVDMSILKPAYDDTMAMIAGLSEADKVTFKKYTGVPFFANFSKAAGQGNYLLSAKGTNTTTLLGEIDDIQQLSSVQGRYYLSLPGKCSKETDAAKNESCWKTAIEKFTALGTKYNTDNVKDKSDAEKKAWLAAYDIKIPTRLTLNGGLVSEPWCVDKAVVDACLAWNGKMIGDDKNITGTADYLTKADAQLKAAKACKTSISEKEIREGKDTPRGCNDIEDLRSSIAHAAFATYQEKWLNIVKKISKDQEFIAVSLYFATRIVPFDLFASKAGIGPLYSVITRGRGDIMGTIADTEGLLKFMDSYFLAMWNNCSPQELTKQTKCFTDGVNAAYALADEARSAVFWAKSDADRTAWLNSYANTAEAAAIKKAGATKQKWTTSCKEVDGERPECGAEECCMSLYNSTEAKEVCFDQAATEIAIADPAGTRRFKDSHYVGYHPGSATTAAEPGACIEGATKLMSAVSALAAAAYMMA